KGVSQEGFTFFTNYESQKGQQLAQNPRACLVFFWKELERQVRIRGVVSKVSKEESEAYFFSRPEGSQIGACASPQSRVIADRQELESRVQALEEAVKKGHKIEKPDYWGGYILKPESLEFWQGRPNRLHARILYTLQDKGDCLIQPLAP